MLNQSQFLQARQKVIEIFQSMGIELTRDEQERIEIVDFGLNELETTGLEVLTYVNNDRYCAKELIMFARQTCPEHKHPPVDGQLGKMETFRCRSGKVWLYVTGKPTPNPQSIIPKGSEPYYTVFKEIELNPGDQFTIPPGDLHWFQAGDEGAVVSEFSSTSRDEFDIFTDPRIKRIAEVAAE